MKRPLPMPRRLAREIRLVTHPADDTPLYQRLHQQLRSHLLSGHVAPGTRLPSARTLAADLGVARNTVEAALAQLVDEGFVERRVGAGTVVAGSLRAHVASEPSRIAATRSRPSARGARITTIGREELARDQDTGPWATNLAHFPMREWNRALARCMRRGGEALLESGHPLGLLRLREEIANHAQLSRGVTAHAGQVLVVTSTQEALDLAARVMLDPGDRVVVEDPGYRSAQAVFLAAGARLVPVRVDAEGLDTGRLPARGRHRLVYVTPSHQFPLGVSLSLERRLELLRWADRQDACVLEDDYDSEFRYDGRPLAALHSLTPAGRVLYMGTYNKVLFPGLRLAYLILPDAWIPSFEAARRLAGTLPSPLLQATLAEFMATGRFAGYLRQSRLFYARCRDRLVSTVTREWGKGVVLGPSATGLHVTAQLPLHVDDVALARAARRHGLSVVPLSRYDSAAGASKGLVISYGAADPARLEAGVVALTRTLHRAIAAR